MENKQFNKILNHYREFGLYTNPGPYAEFYKTLPNDIYELRELVNKQHIHKMSLYRAFKNKDEKSLIRRQYKWQNYRCLDDVLLTSTAMTAELFRLLGKQEFPLNVTDPNKKLVITCRYLAVWYASILKAKGIPCRCRSGFAPYIYDDEIVDHWIVQYYDKNFNRWVNVDSEANVRNKHFNVCNFADKDFIFAADAYLAMRNGTLKDKEKYPLTDGVKHGGDATFAWALLMDFHALFHDEINYITLPVFLYEHCNNLGELKKSTLQQLDNLAKLMQNVDENFEKLYEIWQTNKKLRCVASPLNGTFLHLELDKKDFN